MSEFMTDLGGFSLVKADGLLVYWRLLLKKPEFVTA